MSNEELNLNEMETVSGGKGGSPTPLAPTAVFDVYRVESGDTLTRIAGKFKTSVSYLMAINPTISSKNDITAGYYMYVPRMQR